MATGRRGHLIVFEGLDRAGKSTQCTKLVENLRKKGRQVQHMRFPNRTTPIGKMIDAYLKGDSAQEDHVIHLLFSANRWEAAAEVEAKILSGTDVVLDRYYYSGCVYSAAKHNPSLDLQWARAPEHGLPRPDICLFLNVSTDEAAKRGGFGEERYEEKEMQLRVRQLFQEIQATKDGEDFLVVDGGLPIDKVEATVLEAVEIMMNAVTSEGRELGRVEA